MSDGMAQSVKAAIDAADEHARSTGVQVLIEALEAVGYAVVKLPEPDYMPTTFDWAQGLGVWEFGEGGRVAAWSDGYMVDENGNALGGVDVARAWAAALLAACAAVDAVERSETTP